MSLDRGTSARKPAKTCAYPALEDIGFPDPVVTLSQCYFEFWL